MNRKPFYSALTVLCLIGGGAVSCDRNSGSGKPENVRPEDQKPGDPIAVIDGKVRFYVDIDESAPRLNTGITKDELLSSASAVYVNGTGYQLETDDAGNRYADVMENAAGTYRASLTLEHGTAWYGSNPTIDIKVPSMQFPAGKQSGETSFANYPMYGAYSESMGNKLYMNDLLGLVNLDIKGSGKVVSVKLRSEGSEMSGIFLNSSDKSLVSAGKTFDNVVLNCTDGGQFMPMDNVFSLYVAPGEYSNAEIVICDSEHRVMHTSIDLNVAAGGAVTKEISWSPDKDVIWYEDFDLCAWGGDIMGGSSAFGFAPSAGTTGNDSGKELAGTEYALASVAYNVGGTGYVQPDAWASVSGKTVGDAHQMSESYVKSRNFSDWRYIYRSREFPGMIAVSYNVTTRGIIATPSFGNIDGFHKIKISVKFCALADFADDLLASVNFGGYVESATLDGAPLELKSLQYRGAASEAVVGRNSVTVPSSMASAQKWQTLELVVSHATDATYLHFCGYTSSAGNHGFIVDEIKVEDLGSEMERGNLRVLYWNIQDGMWSDQANEYANFIGWVNRYDPDVCVWCEAASIYKDNTNKSAPEAERRLPAGWPEVAAKYGHKYTATGGWRDNFPQEITSKYPIETLLKITDSDQAGKPIAHGAAIQQIDVNGKKINIVTLHTWPQAYGFGVPTADRDASAAKHEGDYYREFEMKYILEHTVNAPEYASQTDWLMMGDFNSRSYYDEWYYKLGESSTLYLCQNAIRDNSDMVDIIGKDYPGMFMSSTGGNARIDYMFASPSMYSKVKNSMIVIDSYAIPVVDGLYGTGFYNPSDHRPILVDFQL